MADRVSGTKLVMAETEVSFTIIAVKQLIFTCTLIDFYFFFRELRTWLHADKPAVQSGKRFGGDLG